MEILIGSKNPGKIEGAEKAFKRFFDNVKVEGVKVPSMVANEPCNEDIYKGAKNRVIGLIDYAKENNINADYFVAVESGLTNSLGKWMITNIAVIIDKNGYESWGTSSSFPVPSKYVQKIKETELGTVMDEIFSKNDLRSTIGGISYLTHNNITRIDLNESAFIMALTQYVNDSLWKD
jgi:inosine/xanthosine triphosphatase